MNSKQYNNNNKKLRITKHAFGRANERAHRFGSDKGFKRFLIKHRFKLFGYLSITPHDGPNHLVKCTYKKENLILITGVNLNSVVIITVLYDNIQHGNYKKRNKQIKSHRSKKTNTLKTQIRKNKGGYNA